MMEKYKKIAMLMCSLGLMFLVTGITYAYFNYTKTGDENVLITGDIYMNLEEGNDQITLSNIFPETKEEARTRNDNEITFTINGLNTSSKTVYYEIDLTYGDDLDGYTRFNDSDLMFDLVEVGSNNEETYVVNARSFDTINGKRIWVDTVDANTDIEIERTYKLRMWLSDEVIISDTDPNASYPATGTNAFKNHFASVRVRVIGDFQEKDLPGAYYMLAKNADTTTVINFADASSSTNGQGLYTLPGTENDNNPIYYYRGAVDNNNVIFAGFCWQMVRTTETGGIKMIYNGLPDIEGSGDNITYNCGTTRDIQDTIRSTTQLNNNGGYYYADDYEIISTSGNVPTYRLKAGPNGIQLKAVTSTNYETYIPMIAENYPYTCLRSSSPNETCENLVKVDSIFTGPVAYTYSSLDRTIIGSVKYNPSISDSTGTASNVGYMKNAEYVGLQSSSSGSIYGKDIEWDGNNYLVIEETANVASTNTTKDNDHHYSCGTSGTTMCSTVRYYYYNNYYITLSSGDLLEDAIYKMTGNGTSAVKQRNSGYVLNQSDSTIKEYLESWFRTNLTNEVDNTNRNYMSYLEDTIFCSDRSFKTVSGNIDYPTYFESGWNPNGGDLTKHLFFGTWNRYINGWYSTINIPAVKNGACLNETDRFSVESSIAHLNYPIGLLTIDEAILAGMRGNTGTANTTFYLYTKKQYWTLTPYKIAPYVAHIFVISSTGSIASGYEKVSTGVRPVISLKLGVEFEPDGDGTGTNPYVVKYNS